MPTIRTWWPLTGRLAEREIRRRSDGSVQHEGRGDPANPVSFLPLAELGYAMAPGERLAIHWLEVDWDSRQAYVEIEGPQAFIDHLASLGVADQGPDWQSAPRLDAGRCQALLALANARRQAHNDAQRGKTMAEREPDLPMLAELRLPGEV